MFQIIVTVFGIALGALYVGYLAYAIKSIPLWIIVIATFVLIVREFIVEFRADTGNGARSAANKDASK